MKAIEVEPGKWAVQREGQQTPVGTGSPYVHFKGDFKGFWFYPKKGQGVPNDCLTDEKTAKKFVRDHSRVKHKTLLLRIYWRTNAILGYVILFPVDLMLTLTTNQTWAEARGRTIKAVRRSWYKY